MKSSLMLGLISIAILILTSSFLMTGQAWYSSTYPWSQNRHDARHTGSTESTAPSSNSTLWTYDSIGDARARHLVVDGGRVFAIRGGSFFVLDETTGAFILSADGGGGYGGNIGGAYSNGKLYYTSYDYIYGRGTVYCFNATTGDQLWSFDTSPGQIQDTPTVAGDAAYVGTLNNYTYCIENGAQKWYEKLGGPINLSPAVDGDILCVGCDDGQVHAFNIAGAHPVSIWNFTIGYTNIGQISIEDGRVFVVRSPYLYALNETDGSLIWSWQGRTGSGNFPIAVSSGILYVSTPYYTSGLYALYANVTAGNYTYQDPEPRLWADGTVGPVNGFAVAGNRLVFQEINGQTLEVRNALTGASLWHYQTDNGAIAPIVADGHIFVADQLKIYCIGSPYPPVTNTYDVLADSQLFQMSITTNSTVGNVDTSGINPTTLNMSFTVDSHIGGTGMCNITMPNNMLGGPYNITIGGETPWSYVATPLNNSHTSLYFTYNGTGKYTVEIDGTTTTVPEFTLPMTILLSGIAALTIIALRKRRSFK